MALQKYRVICPYCEASLLVTEDLLGLPGICPGCQQEFLLPGIESFLTEFPAEESAPGPAPAASAENFTPRQPDVFSSKPAPAMPSPPPFSAAPPAVPPAPREVVSPARTHKPVRIEGRPALRLLSGLLKVLAGLQVLIGCGLLIGLVVVASKSVPPPQLVLTIVGMAISIGMGAIPMLAFSELILVFIAQEEMLRHLVNHQREKQPGP